MSDSAATDPARARVEHSLRHVVDPVMTLPCRVARQPGEAAGLSYGLACLVAELAVGSLVSREPAEILPLDA